MNKLNKLMESVQDPTGGGPAASSPASASAATESPASSDADGFDFGGLATHDEFADPAPVTSEKAAAPSAPKEALPPESVAPTATPAAPPSAATQQPPSPPEQQQNQPPAAAPVEPSAAPNPLEQPSFEQHRAEFLPKLATLYKMTDDEVEAFRTNPGETLPKLAAQLHYEVQAATFNSVLQAIPQIFEALTKQKEVQSQADTAFYTKWPKLKDSKYQETVINSIRAFKSANPKANLDTTIGQAGLMAMISLGLPLQDAPPSTPAAAPQMSARPAGVGATGHITPARVHGQDDGNIFEALANATLAGEI